MKISLYFYLGLIFCLLLNNSSLFGQNTYQPKTFQGSRFNLPYNVLYPVDFDTKRQYPLLLFLHGAGERGTDNQKQLAHFHELLKNAVNAGDHPAIVVFPHCPPEDYWANAKIDRYPNRLDIEYRAGGQPTRALLTVMELMDSLTQMRFVDKNRVYVGGLSMGGMGTFELLYRRPDMFAAAFPICGGAHPETAKTYASKVKLWVFHGDQDPIVLPQFSIEMVNALYEVGADPRFTRYNSVKHDSWKNAREEPELLPWLFSQRKKTPLRLHSFFADNIVLQRDQPIRIFGTGNPKSTIRIRWKDQSFETKTDEAGKLDFALPAENLGGPYLLTVEDKDTSIVVENIMLGDVWFASGQSNMAWKLEESAGGKEEIASANFDNIRFMMAPREMEFQPVDDWGLPLKWEMANGDQVAKYSGVAYFFAKEIYQETGIPIGIIDASWGGTLIETWMSDAALRPFEIHDFELDLLKSRHLPLQEIEQKSKSTFEQWKNTSYKQGIGLDEKWYERQADLSEWKPIQVPGYWEDQLPEYADFDGAMWYRRSFDVPKSFLPNDIRMWLSQIDDHHICWINGQYIGETYFSKTWTNYLIPNGILKEEDNEIVLRVFDVEGKGGLTGLDSYFDFYPNEDKSVRGRLDGTWLVRPGERFNGNGNENLTSIGHKPNDYLSLLYNGMVHPYRQFPIKGIIWYQGESNKVNAFHYRKLFPALIADWRSKWNLPNLPFYYVQLAAYGEIVSLPQESATAELRESQAITRSVPYTGMATALDLGDPDDIHPLNKADVGKRLARHALKNEYGCEDLIADGPIYLSYRQIGKKLEATFDNTNGLKTVDNHAPKGFEIATESGEFVWAKAEIKKGKIILWHPEIKTPKHIRYAWADSPEVNVVNEAMLPMYPFRTDDRKLLTQDHIKAFK